MRLGRMAAMGMAAAVAVLWAGPGWAQEDEAAEVRLSAIEMEESKDTIDHITQVDIERKTAANLWEALRGVSGVYLQTNSARNESTISLRGSNRFQVGMYIDDIPSATAYRNEWDASNFMLYDIDSIEISKGYSSPLLASNNNLGGAINLRTAKPVKELEFTAKYMNFFDRSLDDQGRMFAASVGTKQDLFYLKATVMQNQQDFFTLPSGFTPSPLEDGGRRENSDSKNRALNFIAGWTPNEDVDIMFGFVRQSYEKGQPFDAAQTSTGYNNVGGMNNGKPVYPFNRFWVWPEYETTRYYLNANVNLTEKAHLKAVAYHDAHKDTAIDYLDTSLTALGPWLTQSYEQYTTGGQLTFDYAFNEAHKLALSAGYRELSHKAYNDYRNSDPNDNDFGDAMGPGKILDDHMVEAYWDLGAEYTFKPIDPLTLVFGASYSTVTAKTLEQRIEDTNQMDSYTDGLDGAKDLFNYQVGAFYNLTDKHELFATFAKKSRFASMRERFYREGRIPMNPDLKPEHALHYEIGYRGVFSDWLKVNSSLYYSEVKDMIISQGPRGAVSFTNLNQADFYGVELGAEALISQYLSAGAVVNYLKWDNRTNENNLTGLPELTSTVYAVISPVESLSIIPQVNMSSGFHWNENPQDPYYADAPGYATADLKAIYDLNENLSLEVGARNILDKEYAYSAYYPEPGRNYFVGLTGRY